MAYAMRSVAQLLLMCDRQDIGLSIDTGSPESAAAGRGAMATKRRSSRASIRNIFVYDNYPGGIGFSAPLFRMQEDLLRATRELVAEMRMRRRLSRPASAPSAKPARSRSASPSSSST